MAADSARKTPSIFFAFMLYLPMNSK